MQKALSPPSERLGLPFSDFLNELFEALAREGVRACVLRNYQEFPAKNSGNDIDFLISPSELPGAVHALRSIPGIRIVGYAERPYVANVFLEGVFATPQSRALEIDFDLSLTWKGLSFLSTEAVLDATISRPSGDSIFFTPSPVHEAIISLLASLLIGGWLKEKYFPQVQRTFMGERSAVIAALSPQFGQKTATRLADSVISGDRRRILGCVNSLRISLAVHSLVRKPFCSAISIIRHYVCEFVVRFSPRMLESVRILSPSTRCEETIIEGLIPILQSAAKEVVKYDLKSVSPDFSDNNNGEGSADSFAETLSSSLLFIVKVVLWVANEWLYQFIKKKNLTIRISGSRSYSQLIAQKRVFGGVFKWFLLQAIKLLPSSDLWIFLDPALNNLQSERQEATSGESTVLEAYRSFVKAKSKYVILDPAKSFDDLIEDAYGAIIESLAQRAKPRIDHRFQRTSD